jgi:hypothetical protein
MFAAGSVAERRTSTATARVVSCTGAATEAGCDQPRRTAEGLSRAAVLGLRLLAHDESLQDAVRRHLEAARRPRGTRGAGAAPASTTALETLAEKQRKLLELHYQDQISAELFAQEEARLNAQIESAKVSRVSQQNADSERDELAQRFDQVVELLQELDIDQVWAAATFRERRVLVEELVEAVTIFPDHLEVKVAGAPKLNVRLGEVGLKESAISGVGGGT